MKVRPPPSLFAASPCQHRPLPRRSHPKRSQSFRTQRTEQYHESQQTRRLHAPLLLVTVHHLEHADVRSPHPTARGARRRQRLRPPRGGNAPMRQLSFHVLLKGTRCLARFGTNIMQRASALTQMLAMDWFKDDERTSHVAGRKDSTCQKLLSRPDVDFVFCIVIQVRQAARRQPPWTSRLLLPSAHAAPLGANHPRVGGLCSPNTKEVWGCASSRAVPITQALQHGCLLCRPAHG